MKHSTNSISVVTDTKSKKKKKKLQNVNTFSLTLLAAPALLWFLIFSYLPMGGSLIAFKNYKPKLGIMASEWIGLDNFKYLFSSNDASRILVNTIFYNFVSIFLVAAFSVFVAILMDVVSKRLYLKVYQSLLFLPRFISWVVVGYIALALFDFDMGVLNTVLKALGKEPVSWYLSPQYWRVILLAANLWKSIGYTSLIYYGAILSIDSNVYEAAEIDGATFLNKIFRITIPLIKQTIIVMTLMSIGNIMRADFGLFYYVPNNSGALYAVTDVLDTYVYRAMRGLGDFATSSAVSFFQSVVGLVMIVVCNAIVKKIDEDSSLF